MEALQRQLESAKAEASKTIDGGPAAEAVPRRVSIALNSSCRRPCSLRSMVSRSGFQDARSRRETEGGRQNRGSGVCERVAPGFISGMPEP